MKASDVMSVDVITVSPGVSVREVAGLLLKHRISALPVVDEQCALVGIISEGDLVRRAELDTDQRRSWWLDILANKTNEALAAEYVKSHSRRVEDIMTRDVVTASPATPLRDIATALEKHRIKRVPIVANGKLVGIVSRSNLVQALASRSYKDEPVSTQDADIRERVMAQFKSEEWSKHSMLNATVQGGTVELWGFVGSEAEKEAARVAAELVPGVKAIENNVTVRPTVVGF
jgi:CBS-domain-containing membrane protein